MSLSDTLEVEVLTWAFTNDAAPTRPTAWYVALFTADPGETGASGEMTGTGYARAAVTNGFSTPTSGAVGCSNEADLVFTNSGGTAWTEATYFGVFGHLSNATPFYGGGQLTAPKTVGAGDTATFATGDLDITLT